MYLLNPTCYLNGVPANDNQRSKQIKQTYAHIYYLYCLIVRLLTGMDTIEEAIANSHKPLLFSSTINTNLIQLHIPLQDNKHNYLSKGLEMGAKSTLSVREKVSLD